MKTIIIVLIILMSGVVWGQEIGWQKDMEYRIEPDSIIKFYPDTLVSTPINWSKNQTVLALLILYDEYEQECYDDSTGTKVGWDSIVWNEDRGRYVLEPGETVWTHGLPLFPGFIEFIRAKISGEKK